MIQSPKPWVFAAPLCGYTRFPYREVLRQYPYDMMYTEMVSVDAMVYENKSTQTIYKSPQGQDNLGVQVVGSKVDNFLYAIEKLSSLNTFKVFDINCGCPVNKVMKTGGGSALLREPEKIFQIVNALTKEFPHLNITTKIRLGINAKEKPYLEIAKAVEEGGAKLLTVHGRTQSQIYNGDVDMEALASIKKSLTIPVIGNGGIFTPEDAKAMIDATQVDGVMVARGMIGTPWIGKLIKEYLHTGTYVDLTDENKIQMMKEHYMQEDLFAPHNGFREFKKSGIMYLKGISHIKPWKIRISLAQTAQEMSEIIEELIDFNLKSYAY